MKKILTMLALITAGALAIPQLSSAGQFTMKQCAGAQLLGMSGSHSLLGSDFVDVVSGCNGTGVDKLGVYQDRSNRRMPFGSGGQFIWYTTGGNEITGTSIAAKLNSRNGIAARLLGSNSSAPNISLDTGSDHSGNPSVSHWQNTISPLTVVVARLHCEPSGGCENKAGSQKAFFEVTDLEFSVRDSRLPSISATGSLSNWGGDGIWHAGGTTYSIGGTDQGSGMSRSFLIVNGSRVNQADASCPGMRVGYSTSFMPCPGTIDTPGFANTTVSPFQEGINGLQFCVEDYSITASSGDPVCTPEKLILVDNRPPESPGELSMVGGSDWRSENRFDLTWTNPTGQHSPIATAQYSMFDDQGVQVQGPVSVNGARISSLDSLEVPAPGEYTVSVRLVDASGNVGTASTATLRFDDGRPGDVAPEAKPGWVSADELPLDQTIERASVGGPSGIDGYAVSVSKDAPETPCPSGSCGAGDLALAGGQDDRTVTIPDLTEGDHWITSVAASGAGLASESARSIEVHVDKTDPSTVLEGVPNDWVNHPVTIAVTATDEASGMSPEPGGDPVTVIEPAGQYPYTTPGSTAKFTIASEGTTIVKYWARDLAGNANDGGIAPDGDRHRPPGSASVRIDTVAPSVEFISTRDPEDPELITATVIDRDSGVRAGQISYRKAGLELAFTPVESAVKDGKILARLPSDDMGKGAYELKVESTDWAGNSSSSRADSTGNPMILSLPLKRDVSVSAALIRKSRQVRSMKLRSGKTTRVTGVLTSSDGSSISGTLLAITETFAAGSRRSQRQSFVRTDGAGKYAWKLGKGPIRSVQVSYGGSSTTGRASSPELRLRTFDRTSLRVNPGVIRNGGTVKMTGRVRGPGGLSPSGGKLIAIQYFDPSRDKWRPAEVLRTNKAGKYFYRYRFRTITTAQRILFRTASLPEAGWPFLPSTSRPKSVIVYPRTGN